MYEALRAALQCAMEQGSEPGVLTITGKWPTRLRLDDQGITVRNALHISRRIGWDQVRWLRDGFWWSGGQGVPASWVLCIVLHNGREIEANATERDGPLPDTLAAIRQAAARHAVPAVLTGRPAHRGQPGPSAGLYVDPGGKLGLREWFGTEWSPYLQVDSATIGHDAGSGPATVRSPVSGREQQRQWDRVASRAKWAQILPAALLGATAIVAAVTLAVFVYALGHPEADGAVAAGLVCVGFGAFVTFIVWLLGKPDRKAAQAAKQAAELARSKDGTPSPLND